MGDTPATFPNLSDLLQGNQSLGNIDLGNIAPGVIDSIRKILGSGTLPSYAASCLPTSTSSLELD
ncbi:hypothetical protein [Acinetobacter sp. TSRC1-2]|uniref:hypothetical protein n=1 Tax=unclassified Acinetobacter TaxID=196816 RepID=UPI003CF0EA5F